MATEADRLRAALGRAVEALNVAARDFHQVSRDELHDCGFADCGSRYCSHARSVLADPDGQAAAKELADLREKNEWLLVALHSAETEAGTVPGVLMQGGTSNINRLIRLALKQDKRLVDCAALIRSTPLAPDTHTGTRQKWVLENAARRIEGREPLPWTGAPEGVSGAEVRARIAEREACAQLADDSATYWRIRADYRDLSEGIAAAIRARNNEQTAEGGGSRTKPAKQPSAAAEAIVSADACQPPPPLPGPDSGDRPSAVEVPVCDPCRRGEHADCLIPRCCACPDPAARPSVDGGRAGCKLCGFAAHPPGTAVPNGRGGMRYCSGAASAAPSPAALDELVREIMADESPATSPAAPRACCAETATRLAYRLAHLGADLSASINAAVGAEIAAIRALGGKPSACCAEAARAMREAAKGVAVYEIQNAALAGQSRGEWGRCAETIFAALDDLPIPGEEGR